AVAAAAAVGWAGPAVAGGWAAAAPAGGESEHEGKREDERRAGRHHRRLLRPPETDGDYRRLCGGRHSGISATRRRTAGRGGEGHRELRDLSRHDGRVGV